MRRFFTLVFLFFAVSVIAQTADAQFLVPYRKGDKWGFCDINKTMVIPVEYDWAEPFYEGLAAVKKGEKFGFINKKGEVVIPFKYEYAKKFEGGIAQVRNTKGVLFWINRKGFEYYDD